MMEASNSGSPFDARRRSVDCAFDGAAANEINKDFSTGLAKANRTASGLMGGRRGNK
jgi:hypothetical protein